MESQAIFQVEIEAKDFPIESPPWCAATIRTLSGSTQPVLAKNRPLVALSRLNSLLSDVVEALRSSDEFPEWRLLAADGGWEGLGGGTGFCLGL